MSRIFLQSTIYSFQPTITKSGQFGVRFYSSNKPVVMCILQCKVLCCMITFIVGRGVVGKGRRYALVDGVGYEFAWPPMMKRGRSRSSITGLRPCLIKTYRPRRVFPVCSVNCPVFEEIRMNRQASSSPPSPRTIAALFTLGGMRKTFVLNGPRSVCLAMKFHVYLVTGPKKKMPFAQ